MTDWDSVWVIGSHFATETCLAANFWILLPLEARKCNRREIKMSEVNDYSSLSKPDLKWKDFSKDFLIKLMNVWQYAWLEMAGQWHTAVEKRFGFEAASVASMTPG
jgi:hypothetical protein